MKNPFRRENQETTPQRGPLELSEILKLGVMQIETAIKERAYFGPIGQYSCFSQTLSKHHNLASGISAHLETNCKDSDMSRIVQDYHILGVELLETLNAYREGVTVPYTVDVAYISKS